MTQKLSPRESVTASVHESGIVLFDASHGRIFSANRTGARIWRRLERHGSVEDAAGDLSLAYGVPLATAREHARRFVAALESAKLVERVAR
jgi:hypothetical protein